MNSVHLPLPSPPLPLPPLTPYHHHHHHPALCVLSCLGLPHVSMHAMPCPSHLCFHSSVLGFTFQRVLPLLTVASISHAPAALGMDVVTLVDLGEESHLFGITAVEAGFPRRFHDLLQQCLVLCKVRSFFFLLFCWFSVRMIFFIYLILFCS